MCIRDSYGIDEVRQVEEESFRLEVTGMVADKRRWRLDELRAMAQIDQVTRLSLIHI